MSFTDKKFEITVFGLIVVIVAGFGYLVKGSKQGAVVAQELVYEMPRPKSFTGSQFDLGNREIDRNYINPFDKKKKDQAKVDSKAQQPAAQAAKKAQAKKKTDAKDKKPKVDINIVNDDSKGSSLTDDQVYSQTKYPQQVRQNAAPKKDAEEVAKDEMSPDQWRALISGQPTQANVNKLIQALLKGDVDQVTYALIVADLLDNTKPEVQALGIYAANYSYNLQIFAAVSDRAETVAAENRAQVQGYLMSYTQGTRLNVLLTALQTNDAQTVTKAAQIVLAGFEQAKSGTQAGGDPRNGRGEGQTSALSSYSKFVPVFQILSQSNDAAISTVAQSALSQMQTVVASL